MGLALAHVVQERLPPAPPARRPRGQQFTHIDALTGLMGVERGQRRQLAVERGRTHVRPRRRQQRHPAVPRRRGQPQPGNELAEILQPNLTPVQATKVQKGPIVAQVMGIRLDRVRGPLDTTQIGQESLNRPDRGTVLTENGPRHSQHR